MEVRATGSAAYAFPSQPEGVGGDGEYHGTCARQFRKDLDGTAGERDRPGTPILGLGYRQASLWQENICPLKAKHFASAQPCFDCQGNDWSNEPVPGCERGSQEIAFLCTIQSPFSMRFWPSQSDDA
jgi:hypothetical protein